MAASPLSGRSCREGRRPVPDAGRCTWPRGGHTASTTSTAPSTSTTVGLAPEQIGEVLDVGPRTRLRRAQRHASVQAAWSSSTSMNSTTVAAALGAVNTVVFEATRVVGYNTDAPGFATGFTEGLPGADVTNVVLLGAGGAGAAVGHALAEPRRRPPDRRRPRRRPRQPPGPRPRRAAPRTRGSTRRVRQAVGPVARTATASCTAPRPAWPTTRGSPFDAALLHPGTVGGRHRLPAAGHGSARRLPAAAGCRTLDGGHMAVHQATTAFELITGITPDAERMSRHFRSLVGSTRTSPRRGN